MPQHGFMAERLLGGGRGEPAVPHPPEGQIKEGTVASAAVRGRKVRHGRGNILASIRMKGPFGDHANQLSH